MGPKRLSFASGSGSGEKRNKGMLSLEVKQGIIEKHERGVRMSELAISSAQIKEVLGKYQDVVDFIDKYHPKKLQVCRVVSQFDDVCLTHFRNILKSRTKQLSIDDFFKKTAKRTRDEEDVSDSKKTAKSEAKESETKKMAKIEEKKIQSILSVE